MESQDPHKKPDVVAHVVIPKLGIQKQAGRWDLSVNTSFTESVNARTVGTVRDSNPQRGAGASEMPQ